MKIDAKVYVLRVLTKIIWITLAVSVAQGAPPASAGQLIAFPAIIHTYFQIQAVSSIVPPACIFKTIEPVNHAWFLVADADHKLNAYHVLLAIFLEISVLINVRMGSMQTLLMLFAKHAKTDAWHACPRLFVSVAPILLIYTVIHVTPHAQQTHTPHQISVSIACYLVEIVKTKPFAQAAALVFYPK